MTVENKIILYQDDDEITQGQCALQMRICG